MNVTIYSDGGTNGSGHGAGGTIIEISSGKSISNIQIASFLGTATNNEGEIFSALIGFYLVKSRYRNLKNVTWVSDSQYAIKSATQYIRNWVQNGWRTANREPVKNQGLWRAFLTLTDDLKLMAEHVKGHSGHKQNEACDLAVNWIRNNVDLIRHEAVYNIDSLGLWHLWDARHALDEIRHLDSSINLLDLSKIFSELDAILENEPTSNKVNIEEKKNTEDCLKELTNGYILAVRDLSDINTYLKSNKDLKAALMYLKKWAG